MTPEAPRGKRMENSKSFKAAPFRAHGGSRADSAAGCKGSEERWPQVNSLNLGPLC